MKISLVLISLVLLSACTQKDTHSHPENITAKELYELHCANCHKKTGKGKFLKGIPPNLFTELTLNQLVEKIKKGEQHHSNMTVYKTMSDEEARKIAMYLLTSLKKQ